ncbi:uncharacterized protein LOC113475161 [Ciona intestinalis]
MEEIQMSKPACGEKCPTCEQIIEICPTCEQRVITTQPEKGMDIDKAIEKSEKVIGCCSKMFSCITKANTMAENLQD